MTESAEKNFPAYSHLPYLYLGDNSDVLDVSAPFNIESYKTAEGQYAIPFKAKYLKLTDNSVQSGDVLSSLVMRVAQD